MSTLRSLAIGNGELSGSLPADLGLGVPNLGKLEAPNNLLSGFIPSSLRLLTNLQLLQLDNNSFSGFIPSSLCLLKNLEWVGFANNNLTIDTSSTEVNFLTCLANLTNLRRVYLNNNPLNTELTNSFSNFSASLDGIYLPNCSLRGKLSDGIGSLEGLMSLYLSGNQLSGLIPSSIGKLHNLQGLDLSDNTLEGSIPNELCHLQNLVGLSLAGNQLTGSIPPCLSNLTTSLRYLVLGSNFLNSTIPSTLWKLRDLLALDLASNSLVGTLPGDVGNLNVVVFLDLSYNRLSGSIPSSIGSLLSMMNLSLAHNNLEGSIPNSIGACLSLVHLDLSLNNLSGVIPKSLEKLSYLKYLNLSNNELQGEIPTGGPFNNFSAESFVLNHRLCGTSRFQVPPCKTRSNVHVLKYVVPGILSLILLVVSLIWLFMLRGKRNVIATFISEPQGVWRRISYLELQNATDGFSESNLLGVGGFGSVYKGTLPDGMDVAIKVFNLDLEEGFTSFEVECEVLSAVRHRNLVKIISCCSQIDFKGIVLNYMPNGSLEEWLYSRNSSLSIMQRLDIMIDVASALEYLHHGYGVPIVHCDLKPSNILLDEDMVAHVADFGVAKLLGGGDSMTQTMTLATIGYMAPEYGTGGIVTRRGDVYSFGVVMMETFTRRKPTDEIFVGELRMNRWIAEVVVSDEIAEVVDVTLLETEEDHDYVSRKECISSVMRLAITCCAESAEARINIQEAVTTLKRIKTKFLKDSAVSALNRRPIS